MRKSDLYHIHDQCIHCIIVASVRSQIDNSLKKYTINPHMGFQPQRWVWFIIYEPWSGPRMGLTGRSH